MNTQTLLLNTLCILAYAHQNVPMAHATELIFRVHSAGGDELYLCDAGIRHLEPSGVIRWQNELDSVVANYKRWKGDYPIAWDSEPQVSNLFAWNGGRLFDNSGTRIPRTIASTRSEDHLPHVEAKLQTKVESLKFNFSSPFFGSEYFVDICYRGKALLWPPPGLEIPINYELKSWVTATSLASHNEDKNRSYLAMARPKLTASLVCDYQNSGPMQGAPQAPRFFASDVSELPVEHPSPLGEHLFSREVYNEAHPQRINPATYERFSFTPLSFEVPMRLIWGAQNSLPGAGTTIRPENLYNECKANKFVRYCVARYTFAESPTVGEDRNGVMLSRGMLVGDARFDIFLDLKQTTGASRN
jgi:hypothetical protein